MEDMKDITFHTAVHSTYPDGRFYPLEECPVYGHQIRNESISNADEVFIHRDGRFMPVVYSVCPLQGGYEHGAVVEFRDVTREKQMEEERLKALIEAEQSGAQIRHEAVHRQKLTEFIDFGE